MPHFVAFDCMEKFFPQSKIRIQEIQSEIILLKLNVNFQKFLDLDLDKETLVIIGGSLGLNALTT